MSEDEAIKAVVPLAQGIVRNAYRFYDGRVYASWKCNFCKESISSEDEEDDTFYILQQQIYRGGIVKGYPHKADCIVKLAEEFIK